MGERLKRLMDMKWVVLGIGVLLGAIIIMGIRFVSYAPPHETHYHANFGVYIDGARVKFEDQKYYEEVNLCSLHGTTPPSRVHMHGKENSIIHVHADAVTWGHFFANLGWTLGPDFISDGEQVFTADDGKQLNIILNGQTLTGISLIANQMIGDKDRLLLSYGADDKSILDAEYKTIEKNAEEYNNKPDPAACAGDHEVTIGDRLRNML